MFVCEIDQNFERERTSQEMSSEAQLISRLIIFRVQGFQSGVNLILLAEELSKKRLPYKYVHVRRCFAPDSLSYS